MKNANVLESQWKHIRRKVRPHWMALTDDDVERIEGDADMLIELLQEKYGYSRLVAEEEVRRFVRDISEAPA